MRSLSRARNGVKNFSTAIIAAFLAGLTYWLSPVTHSPDSRWVLPTAVSLVTEGNIGLNEYRDIIKARGTYGLRRKKREFVNFFPVGPALIAAPFVEVMRRHPDSTSKALGISFDGSGGSFLKHRRVIEHLIASIVCGAAVGVLFLMLLPVAAYPLALLLACAAGWSSTLWSVASRGLWQHGPAMLCLGGALAVLVRRSYRAGASQARWFEALSLGGLLAAAYLMRPTTAAAIVSIGLYLLFTDRRGLALMILGALPIAIPFVVQNIGWYGDILPPYYRGEGLRVSATVLEAFAANLVSPSRGILFLSAWTVVSFLTLRRGMSGLVVCLWGWCAAHLIAVSLFDRWWAGHSFGPRFMSEVLPPLLILSALGIQRVTRRRAAVAALGALVMLSGALHAAGALSYTTVVWNRYPVDIDAAPGRVWSVLRPQSLAPLYLKIGVPRSSRPDEGDNDSPPAGSTP